MRILIAGAGATGGYFGARLVQASRDVTFLVRPRRAEQLRAELRLVGPSGEETVPIATITAEDLDGTYDLVIVAVKAGALPTVIDHIAPAVGEKTMVLPFLNGMAHLMALNHRFGAARVLGGIVKVVATMADDGAIHQMYPTATLPSGPSPGRSPTRSAASTRSFPHPGSRPRWPRTWWPPCGTSGRSLPPPAPSPA